MCIRLEYSNSGENVISDLKWAGLLNLRSEICALCVPFLEGSTLHEISCDYMICKNQNVELIFYKIYWLASALNPLYQPNILYSFTVKFYSMRSIRNMLLNSKRQRNQQLETKVCNLRGRSGAPVAYLLNSRCVWTARRKLFLVLVHLAILEMNKLRWPMSQRVVALPHSCWISATIITTWMTPLETSRRHLKCLTTFLRYILSFS